MKRSREPEDLASGPSEADTGSRSYPGVGVEPAAKLLGLDTESSDIQEAATMKCSLPPHRDTLSFDSYAEYETHYSKAHLNRCLECRKNFPSDHFLSIHIEESHDSFVAVRREKGERTVRCLPLTLPYKPPDSPPAS